MRKFIIVFITITVVFVLGYAKKNETYSLQNAYLGQSIKTIYTNGDVEHDTHGIEYAIFRFDKNEILREMEYVYTKEKAKTSNIAKAVSVYHENKALKKEKYFFSDEFVAKTDYYLKVIYFDVNRKINYVKYYSKDEVIKNKGYRKMTEFFDGKEKLIRREYDYSLDYAKSHGNIIKLVEYIDADGQKTKSEYYDRNGNKVK